MALGEKGVCKTAKAVCKIQAGFSLTKWSATREELFVLRNGPQFWSGQKSKL